MHVDKLLVTRDVRLKTALLTVILDRFGTDRVEGNTEMEKIQSVISTIDAIFTAVDDNLSTALEAANIPPLGGLRLVKKSGRNPRPGQ